METTLTKAIERWRNQQVPPRELVEEFKICVSWTADALQSQWGGDCGGKEFFRTKSDALSFIEENFKADPTSFEVEEDGDLSWELEDGNLLVYLSA